MRISSFINTVENGIIRGAKATARQARRVNDAVRVELAAAKIADGERERVLLANRNIVERFEIRERAEELITKHSESDLRALIANKRKAMVKAVVGGASVDVLNAHAEGIARIEALLPRPLGVLRAGVE